MSVAELELFVKQAENSDFVPTKETIMHMGNVMVDVATQTDGYKDIVWKAGIYLLILASEQPEIDADEFFSLYGMKAIANALGATLKTDFPIGLSFIVYGFMPNNGLEGIVQDQLINSHIRNGLSLTPEQLVENFRNSSFELRKATASFIEICLRENLSINHLAIAAALLVSSPDTADEPHVVRVFLDSLAATNKDICLFYSWRAAAKINPNLWNDSSYISVLPQILKRINDLGEDSISVLVDIFEDTQVISSIVVHEDLLTLFGMAGWWIYIEHEQAHGLDVAWRFILAVSGKYPHWADAMRVHLQGKQLFKISPQKVEQLQLDFKFNMQKLREESRLRSYRGVPLALQIQRYNLVNIFEPLYEALEGSSAINKEDLDRIRLLNAYELIDENPLQKSSQFPIVGELRAQMINNYAEILSLLNEVLSLRKQLDSGELGKSDIQKATAGNSAARQEIERFLNQYPELSWAIEKFIPGTLYQ